MNKEPGEWMFKPLWLVLLNKLLRHLRLKAYLAVTPQCRLRLRIRLLGKPEPEKRERK